MKIAICSDIHDNLVNLEKFLAWCKNNNINEIICVGDVTNADTLKFIANRFPGIIHLVRGNMEIYEEEEVKKYRNIKYYGRIGNLSADEINAGFCHEPYLISQVLKSADCHIIFYGHTHKPWLSYIKSKVHKEIKTVNPGTLGGVFQRATFAFWDTKNKKLELKLIEEI